MAKSKYHTFTLTKPNDELDKIQNIMAYLPNHVMTDHFCYYMARQCMEIGDYDCYHVLENVCPNREKWFEARKHADKTEYGFQEYITLYFYERSGKKGSRSYETQELFI